MFNYFTAENRAVCEIMWKNMVKARQATNNSTIRRMRFACWIIKATHTRRICNTYCFSTTTLVTRTCLYVTLYVRCLSFLYFADRAS